MPRTQEQNNIIRQASRQKILKSAAELFARSGYAQTSVRMIARHAGVSSGLMYNYFESKEELLKGIFENSRASLDALLDENISINDFVTGFIGTFSKFPSFWRLFYQFKMQPLMLDMFWWDLQEWTDSLSEQLVQLFISAGVDDPDLEAKILWATLDGFGMQLSLHPESTPVKKMTQIILSRLPLAQAA